MSLNGGSSKVIATAADVQALSGEFMRLTARAGLAAGYKVEVRNIRYENMIYANGKHFHPFTCWEHCVRLIVDTKGYFVITADKVAMFQHDPEWDGGMREVRHPTTDAEYRNQMCSAVVHNVAKGFPV